MEPNAHETPGLALPLPAAEQVGAEAPPAAQAGQVFGSHETGVVSPEVAAAVAQQPSMAPPPIATAADPAVGTVVTPPMTATSQVVAAPSITGDDDSNTDQLDKEWIEKAKAIIAQTKSDPYMESHEISKAKADYLRIRYNKTVKVAEDIPR
ncbi:MAG TPA: hypothetical protein VLH84_02930 [Patescibacteria group bacterium]|nr:hypothetical protein [Patescibacteria group bacterium]